MEARDITRLGREAAEEINISEPERWASVILGGMLALFGIQRRSFGGALLALSGAALIRRGATGHCYTYDALDVNTADEGADAPLPRRGDRVDEASVESFPASDSPAWTPTTGPGGPRP